MTIAVHTQCCHFPWKFLLKLIDELTRISLKNLLFTISLYVSFSIIYILRGENRDARPSLRRAVVCTIHLHIAFDVMVAGFIMLNICLIAIGENQVGWTGIGLIVGVPIWFIMYARYERRGKMEDRQDERPVPVPLPKLSEN